MGNTNSGGLTDDDLQSIEQETGFTSKQIQRLHKRFQHLDKDNKGYLDRENFEHIPELIVNPLGDRLIEAFFTESVGHPDKNYREYNSFNPTTIDFRQFVRVLAYFRPITTEERGPDYPNSRLNKLRFAFSMYDLEKNNFVTREEFRVILNTMIGANISKEQLDNIVDRTIIEADLDKDDRISFEEFCRAMDRIDIEQKMSIQFTN